MIRDYKLLLRLADEESGQFHIAALSIERELRYWAPKLYGSVWSYRELAPFALCELGFYQPFEMIRKSVDELIDERLPWTLRYENRTAESGWTLDEREEHRIQFQIQAS